MAVRQAPTSVVQNVISALVEDPAELRRTAAAASAAAVLPGTAITEAVDAPQDSEEAQAAAQLDADELLKQAEEQAGDQVRHCCKTESNASMLLDTSTSRSLPAESCLQSC